MEELILEYFTILGPSIISILGIICMVVKVVKKFNELRAEIKDKTELNDIKEQFKIVLKENVELKKKITTLVNKIDKIRVNEDIDK